MAESIELLPIGLTRLSDDDEPDDRPDDLADDRPDDERGGAPGLATAGPRLRRAKPRRHLADLDTAGRRAAVTELGQPGYRADQLSRHYFARLTDDPADMTDLPVPVRERTGRGAAAAAADRAA